MESGGVINYQLVNDYQYKSSLIESVMKVMSFFVSFPHYTGSLISDIQPSILEPDDI
jgi:hypothetical protein